MRRLTESQFVNLVAEVASEVAGKMMGDSSCFQVATAQWWSRESQDEDFQYAENMIDTYGKFTETSIERLVGKIARREGFAYEPFPITIHRSTNQIVLRIDELNVLVLTLLKCTAVEGDEIAQALPETEIDG